MTSAQTNKFLHWLVHKQISFYIDQFLSLGYRKCFISQHTFLSLIEKWKKVLDNKGYSGAILMDFSKAFDTINHDLLISKESLKLIKNYLTDRWKRTKLNTDFSK